MNTPAFKKGLSRVLLDCGFQRLGKSLRRDQSGASVLVSFEKGFGNQWYVNIGFWLHALGDLMTDRVEQTHFYIRLDRMVPSSREIILTAGNLDDAEQSRAYETLITLYSKEIDARLRALGTDEGLRNAAKDSLFTRGLIRKEARHYLAA